jgi:hypothetical protein
MLTHSRDTMHQHLMIMIANGTPPLWSSVQNFWLQIQRSGSDSRYQMFWEVMGLQPSPLSLVSTIEGLFVSLLLAFPLNHNTLRFFTICATCPFYLIIRDVIIQNLLKGAIYETSSLIRSNILLRTLFSNASRLSSSHKNSQETLQFCKF